MVSLSIYQDNRIRKLVSRTASERSDYSDIKKKADFFDERTGIVMTENDDDNYYHRYDCQRFKGYDGKYLIYNTTAAKNKGYTPCPRCH